LDREISGQVSVVRGDGESVKLGLVEVRIFEANEFANQLRSASQSLAGDRAEAEQLKQRTDQFGAKLKRIVDHLGELARATSLEATDQKFSHLESSGMGLIIVDIPHLKTDVEHYAEYVASAAPLFAKIALRPLVSTKTDADGRFVVAAPRGHNLAAVASAKRYSGDSEEFYFWAVNVPGKTVTLSNDNEVSSGGGESLVHCAPLRRDIRSDLKEKQQLEARLVNLTKQASDLIEQASAIPDPSPDGHPRFDRSVVTGLLEEPPPASGPSVGQHAKNDAAIIGSIKLLQSISIQIPSGGTSVLPAGTVLQYSALQSGYLQVHYAGTSYWVPKDKTDFAGDRITPEGLQDFDAASRATKLAAEERKKEMPASTLTSAPSPKTMSDSRKAIALSAPRPDYPYEARSRHITGSGVVVMTIDVSTGAVTDASMAQSTGSPILDNAAVSAFRRWRFAPGTTQSTLRIPVNYTATGVSY
jgi:TonB family protein